MDSGSLRVSVLCGSCELTMCLHAALVMVSMMMDLVLTPFDQLFFTVPAVQGGEAAEQVNTGEHLAESEENW